MYGRVKLGFVDLAKEQRNQIFLAVAAGRLDPDTCKMDHRQYDTGFTISHSPTGSSFAALAEDGSYRYLLRIANDPVDLSWHDGNSWPALLDAIRLWSHDVANWAETPDLWMLRHDWKSFVSSYHEEASNSRFTQDEQDVISIQLSAIRDSVKKNYELTKAQLEKLDEKFEELRKDSKRLGRKDWKNIVIAGFFGLVLTDAITPGIFEHIFILLEHGIGYLFIGPAAGGILSAGQD